MSSHLVVYPEQILVTEFDPAPPDYFILPTRPMADEVIVDEENNRWQVLQIKHVAKGQGRIVASVRWGGPEE